MLKKVTINKGDGWTRWAKDPTEPPVAIAPNDYYMVYGSIKQGSQEAFKNRMAPIAAVSPDGKFHWLLPYEKWVKVVYDGQLTYKVTSVADTKKNRQELAKFSGITVELVDSLRTWQRQQLYDHMLARENKRDFREGCVVRVGGGKTLAGLIIANHYKQPVVLAPRWVWTSWRDEATKWGVPCPALSTYQSAHKIDGADCVIMDEVLTAANPEAQLHTHAVGLSVKAQTVVGYTGTPRSVTPMDLRWLRAVVPGSVPGDEKPWRFLFGLDTQLLEVKPGLCAYVTKTWDEEAVSRFVSPHMRVVKPEEILAELPDITYKRIYVPRPADFELIARGAATESGKMKALAQTRMCTDGCITDDAGKILAEVSTAKRDAISSLVRLCGEPVVIFARWDYMVERLCADLGGRACCAVLRGGSDYSCELARFLSGEVNILVANAAISSGLNLQDRARMVVFASWSLRPTDREQAIGRVYRPGQKRGVIVVDVLAENTLDETTLTLLEKHGHENEQFIEAALLRELEKWR